jgi:magnesium chelatase family protein
VRGSDFLTCTSAPFESIRARVQAARYTELQRFSKIESPNIVANADIRIGEITQFCKLQDEGQSLMRAATPQLNLSARAYHHTRSVKLARRIADLASSDDIHSAHLAEALHASRPSEIDDWRINVLFCRDCLASLISFE